MRIASAVCVANIGAVLAVYLRQYTVTSQSSCPEPCGAGPLFQLPYHPAWTGRAATMIAIGTIGLVVALLLARRRPDS